MLASSSNKTSKAKQKLQEAGAEIYQIPTFKKRDYTLTQEQLREIFDAKRLVFCSAESVAIMLQSCAQHRKDIRSLQGVLQHMNHAAEEALTEYGLFSEQARFSTKPTVYLGRNINRIAVIRNHEYIVSISTSGKHPAFAKRIKQELIAVLPQLIK